MNSFASCFVLIMAGMFVLLCEGCSSAGTTTKAAAVLTKEEVFAEGHRYYLQRQYDSADVYLRRCLAMDSTYVAAMIDLGEVHFDRASEGGGNRARSLTTARDYFVLAERQGADDSQVYERICEISSELDDRKMFLRYAKKNTDKYPYERQFHNLGIAYVEAGEYQEGITFLKDAIGKFPLSNYIGSYHRQLGRAYYKIDRQQTAARTFESGVTAVDGRIAEGKKSDRSFPSGADYARLMDDKVGMLIMLKGIYQLHKETEKLQRVERLLREAGYDK